MHPALGSHLVQSVLPATSAHPQLKPSAELASTAALGLPSVPLVLLGKQMLHIVETTKTPAYKNSSFPRTIINWNNLEEDVITSDTVAAFRSKLVADCAAGKNLLVSCALPCSVGAKPQ